MRNTQEGDKAHSRLMGTFGETEEWRKIEIGKNGRWKREPFPVDFGNPTTQEALHTASGWSPTCILSNANKW